MKRLARIIYSLFLAIDERFGFYSYYEGETAPYCGHHYSGHDGRWTTSSYHEGDGGKSTLKMRWLLSASHNTSDGWHLKFFPWRWNLKMWFRGVRKHFVFRVNRSVIFISTLRGTANDQHGIFFFVAFKNRFVKLSVDGKKIW